MSKLLHPRYIVRRGSTDPEAGGIMDAMAVFDTFTQDWLLQHIYDTELEASRACRRLNLEYERSL